MPRKPYFREFDGWWYAQIRAGKKRKQVKLVRGRENEQEAYRAFCRLMAEEGGRVPEPTRLTVAVLCDLFLDHSERHNDRRTYDWYKKFLQDFCDQYGKVVVTDIKPFHVNRWLDLHKGWGYGSRRCAIISVKRAFNWAFGEGVLRENPLRALKKPPQRNRERTLTPNERAQIFAAIRDRAFRDFVFALQETGCRPSEVARVTAENVDLERGLWVFPEHKTKKRTGRARVVYLTPAMVALSKRLVEEHPSGPLFRGPRNGEAFTRNGIRCRFRRLRKKLPHLKGVISYTFRHSFATDALEKGVGVVQVAELLGHTSTDMVVRHYQHLRERREHLRQAAAKATEGLGAPPSRE